MKKGAKRITLVDRVKRAIDAFRGKPRNYINIGIDVKRCKTCDFKNREEVAYLCDRKQCEVCCYPECEHTFDINHAKNFDSDRFEIDACAECNNMDRELIKDLANQLEDAHETIESRDMRIESLNKYIDNILNGCVECRDNRDKFIQRLEQRLENSLETNKSLRKRLEHLLQSDFIRAFDALDPKTHTYKLDIEQADYITGFKPMPQSTDTDKVDYLSEFKQMSLFDEEEEQ
jgi:hypothetical protein